MHALLQSTVAHNYPVIESEGVTQGNAKGVSLECFRSIMKTNARRVLCMSLNWNVWKEYNNKLYLSSTSSTVFCDDDDILCLQELRAHDSRAAPSKALLPIDCSQPREGMLENLLIWARNRQNNTATFHCKVMIENFQTKKGWNYPSCGYEKCRKGATCKLGKWVYEACNRTVNYPVFRYRLEVVVADDTAHTVVVMFNDTATELLKCSAESLMGTKDENSDAEDELNLYVAIRNLIGTDHVLEIKSHTYYEYGSFESFNCWKIIPNASAEDGASSSTAAVTANDVESPMKIVTKPPTVCTPLKPNEEKKQKRVLKIPAKVCTLHRLTLKQCLHADASRNNQGTTPSFTDILQNSVRIEANTVIKQDGRVQSYCGIRLTETTTDYSVTYYDIVPPTYQCRNCGATMWYKEREEDSKMSANPTFTLCCKGGKVLLPRFHDTPPPLDNLLSHDQPSTSNFRDNIRVYNSMSSFTSFGAKIDNSINTRRAPYTFRTPAFMDKETSEDIDKQIVGDLINMLDRYSSVAHAFRMARDWCNTHSSADFRLRLHSERKTTRQYNSPTMSEVATIIINDFGDAHPTPDIVVDRKDKGLQRMSELHPSYMAL
ncbi:DNA helicase PIF1, ATP-dependent [Tanacetum coccineum]